MENLVIKTNKITMTHFNCSVRDFIVKGVDKGRHYYYLRDVLKLNDENFCRLMQTLNIDVAKVEATKADYDKIFEEPAPIIEEEVDEFEREFAYA